MSAPKRERTAPSYEWDQLQLRLTWPEQQQYELIRPIVLFGLTLAERTEQFGTAARTFARQAGRFDAEGSASFFDRGPPSSRLTDDIRQALRDLKAECAGFGLRELAEKLAREHDRDTAEIVSPAELHLKDALDR